MNALLAGPPPPWILADLVERFGPMLLSRICFDPSPGTDTVDDVLKQNDRESRLVELVDGILVEKVKGFRKSLLAVAIAGFLHNFLAGKRLGNLSGTDGMMQLAPGLVRIPDAAYCGVARLPGGKVPEQTIPSLAPDLAVEVLRISHTKQELSDQRQEYFEAGCPLVWEVDPCARTVMVDTGL